MLYFVHLGNTLDVSDFLNSSPKKQLSHHQKLLLNKFTHLYSTMPWGQKAWTAKYYLCGHPKNSNFMLVYVPLTERWYSRKQFFFVFLILLSLWSGVPQGSMLGPLLFLIYINDLNQCSEHLSDLKFIHFADSSTLYAKGKTLSCLTSKINQELQKVAKWPESVDYL